MKSTNKGYIIPIILIVLLLTLAGFVWFSGSISDQNNTINPNNIDSGIKTTNTPDENVLQDSITTSDPNIDEASTTTDDVSATTSDSI